MMVKIVHPLKCVACGASLPENTRFCESCGQPVLPNSPKNTAEAQSSTRQTEHVLGHIPIQKKVKGIFGRTKYTDYELLITDQQLLFLRPGDWDERWLYEQIELGFDTLMLNEEFSRWRKTMDRYDFAKQPWTDYYSTPIDELLAANRRNFAVAVDTVVHASILLDDEIDTLKLVCTDGIEHLCKIYLLLGHVTHRLLAQVLDHRQLSLNRK